MKVTQVAICPTEASEKQGRPSLTPELLAASGARYSRNNEGLDAILEKIDPDNMDKSVDSIFKMVDYGHQSIADMVPVAMFIDELSIWLAYYVWSLCPVVGGQESSTRYIKMSADELISPHKLGIPEEDRPEWHRNMVKSFENYQKCVEAWTFLAEDTPAIMGIPQSVIDDPKQEKKLARMKRNYAFDRSRYYLPVAGATNMMLVMSARAWVTLAQNLYAHSSPDARDLASQIRGELEIASPRMMKHAEFKPYMANGHEIEFSKNMERARAEYPTFVNRMEEEENRGFQCQSNASLEVLTAGSSESEIYRDLMYHENRYAWVGTDIQRTMVRFGWDAVSFAEIRDLNRHRTGTKYCPLVPRGFYYASEMLPKLRNNLSSESVARRKAIEQIEECSSFGRHVTEKAMDRLISGDSSYVYWTLLGTEYRFEHSTTADKFIYEAELRTGIGSHFRYAQHLRDVLKLWYKKYPSSKGLILEGSAEPE